MTGENRTDEGENETDEVAPIQQYGGYSVQFPETPVPETPYRGLSSTISLRLAPEVDRSAVV
jgi:hypothetical protein